MLFSIIVVCLNPGKKLKDTLDSILGQDYKDYEIIVKDGGSTDGSLEAAGDLLRRECISFYQQKDQGIYDAMNQAVEHAQGAYLFFLNCGDSFHDSGVLSRVAQAVSQYHDRDRLILYGRIYGEKNRVWITPSPKITGFTCYRNVPCHQACFYSVVLCREKAFEQKYRIRGDYEHFLWCYYRGGASPVYLDTAIADYEGGGYSETKENLKRSKREHREITGKYMSRGERLRYRAALLCTLAPLRSFMADNRYLSGIYNRLRSLVYGRRH
ncbi:MAG: glycosyltransferase [Roseburia sp.]|nr:glycosyltransferase [Roseburia sp.]